MYLIFKQIRMYPPTIVLNFDSDAAWELEPNAYQDLLVRHDRCDIEPCQCPLGTKHNEADR